MRAVVASLVLIAIGGCNRSVYSDWSREKTAERADIADVNARNSLARIAELESEISSLKSQVATLEDRLEVEESNTKSNDEWAERAIDSLYENDKIIADRIGLPVGDPR